VVVEADDVRSGPTAAAIAELEARVERSDAFLPGTSVISSDDGTADYVYMHLRDKALVSKGDTVTTGQTIGYVGRTGDATACHLHFELWPAPGWYTGGQATDPLPSLKAWDGGAV